MKILIYNIGYSTGLKGSWRDYFLKSWRYFWAPKDTILKIIQLLKGQKADVICLLETDVGSLRNRFRSHVKMAAEALFLPFYDHALKYGPNSWARFFPTLCKQHDAILSRTKGVFKKHYLKSGTKKLVLEFRVGKISIFVAHFGLLRASLRKRQMEEMTEILKKCDRPYLVCGDFNIFKGLSEVHDFIEANTLKLVQTEPTFPSIKPKRHLDLIFACESIKIKSAGAISALFSDHLPVYVEIET